MADERSVLRRPRRVAVGRLDSAAKALGLGIGLLLGFFVLNLAHMPGSLERQAELDRQEMQRAEVVQQALDFSSGSIRE